MTLIRHKIEKIEKKVRKQIQQLESFSNFHFQFSEIPVIDETSEQFQMDM